MNDTFDRIRALIAEEFALQPAAITPDTLLTDLGVDSLAALEFAFRVEDALGIRLQDDTDLRTASVADLVRVVERAGFVATAPTSQAA